jgi:hypothetical protein
MHAQSVRFVFLGCLAVFSLNGCKKNAAPGGGKPIDLPPSASLDIPLYPQELGNWCWAASGQMVMKNLGLDVNQCTQATDEFGGLACCPSKPAKDGCDTGGWPEFDKHSVHYIRTNGSAVSLATLKQEIAINKKPVIFTWKWTDGGGHMMVAVGYSSTNGQDIIEVNDPWKPDIGNHRWMTYTQFVASSDHKHWDDFYAFSR